VVDEADCAMGKGNEISDNTNIYIITTYKSLQNNVSRKIMILFLFTEHIVDQHFAEFQKYHPTTLHSNKH